MRTAPHQAVAHPKMFAARDPRFLIVIFLTTTIAAFFVRSVWGLALLTVYLLALYGIAGGRLAMLKRTARNLILFVLIIVAVNAVLVGGKPLPRPFSFASGYGIGRGLFYSLRVVTIYTALLVLFVSTSPESLAQGVSVLFKPLSRSFSQRIALYGFLSLGFLPLFVDELDRIRVAQRFRGGGIEGGLRQRLAGARALIVPLFVSAIHRSGQLAMAVELRGVSSTIERILVLERPSRADYVFAFTTLTALVVAVRL